VSRRTFQLVAALVILLAALTPLMECFDHWDTKPGPGNDTEISLTAWFVGVGVVLTLAESLRRIAPLAVTRMKQARLVNSRPTPRRRESRAVEPTGSPPLIPLRI
jgi:hypothetical protein